MKFRIVPDDDHTVHVSIFSGTDTAAIILVDCRHLCKIADDDPDGFRYMAVAVTAAANSCTIIIASRSNPHMTADDDAAGYLSVLTGSDAGTFAVMQRRAATIRTEG